MNSVFAFALLMLGAAPLAAHAQSVGTCAAPPTMLVKQGSVLDIDSRSAGFEIVGTPQDGIRVFCELNDVNDRKKISVVFSQEGGSYKLRLRGGPSSNVRIRIEVPQKMNLVFRATAGECRIENIDGNKDVRLSFGEISFSSITPEKYASVAASVMIGDVQVPAGNNTKQFLQSFKSHGASGLYQVRAHVITGNISFR